MRAGALVAAVVPSAPLLVPALAGGAVAVDHALRSLVREAVVELLADADADEPVTVVGDALSTGPFEGTWDWSGFSVASRGAGTGPPLPLALALGGWLLDEVDSARPRSYLGVAANEDARDCWLFGEELGATRLLVVGDGSARRSEKAPGHFDARADAFDAQAERALREGDPAALMALDAGLARELMAAGRAPWQVLAGAASGQRVSAEVRYAEAPYGVGYLVASWSGSTP